MLYWGAIREIKTSIAQHSLDRYGIRLGVIRNTFTRPVDRLRFHLIDIARISDGDLMRKYVCRAVLYSGAFGPFRKKDWAQIDNGIGDLEAGITRIEKDRTCTWRLLNSVTRATLIFGV